MELIWKMILVAAWSSTKYLIGFTLALASGFNFLELMFTVVGGGMLGVLFYLYLWTMVVAVYRRFYPKKNKPVKFSKTKRIVVKIIKEYELYGVAFLTPMLLTMPVGTILAASIETNKWRIKLFMFVSLCGWTLALFGLKELFGVDLSKLFS